MKYTKIENGWVLRLEKGNKVTEKITEFVKSQKLKSAWFTGIGALESAEVAFYILKQKEFITKKIDQPTEVVSLNGNISKYQNKTALHSHVILSNKSFKTYAGHLNEAIVGATLEIMIWDLKKDINREYNEEIGLKLFDI